MIYYNKKNGKFMIDFFIIYLDDTKSKEKRTQVNNCYNDLHAKIRLDEYCKRKYLNVKTIEVIQCLDYTFMF